MKTMLLLLLLIGRLHATTDDRAFLWAISQVESGGNDNAVGPCGARGRYQISQTTWHRFAPKGWAHERAHNPASSEVVALRNTASIKKTLSIVPQDDEKRVVFAMASAWLVGPNASPAWVESPRVTDYCQRVWNLYLERKLRE